jgi:hypothetical protein
MGLSPELRVELEYIIEPHVRQFCGPVFFTKSLESAKGNIIANGSFGLVDTGERKLLVTCHHVWKEFQNARLTNATLQMGICLDVSNPVVFDPVSPIDENQELDLATFDISSLTAACQGRKFYSLAENPPRNVADEDRLFFIGFPGKNREVRESDGALGFVRAPFAVLVCSVSKWKFLADISGLAIPPHDFGGISGCPCFLIRENRTPQLVGFATSVWSDCLSITHAKCLNRDGTIRPL